VARQQFNPNAVSFDAGLERLRAFAEKTGFDQSEGIVTSRSRVGREATRLLKVANVPDSGFSKWQLPVYLDRASQLFITVAQPGLDVPEHSHDEGDGIRFIVAGSIEYDGTELTAGDWMFVPQGKQYSFTVGDLGAIMCYCYCCCCAGLTDLFGEDVVNPSPELRLGDLFGEDVVNPSPELGLGA
jgi:hypothetical protein